MFVNPYPQPFLSFFLLSSYPDDPPLFFEEFPEHDHWIYADTMTEDEYRTYQEIDYSKFSLGIVKDNAKDLMNARYAQASATCELIPDVPGPLGCSLPNLAKSGCYAKAKVEQKVYGVLYYLAKIA